MAHRVADVYNPAGSLGALENPEDPMQYLPEHRVHPEQPSIWAWPELQQMWANSVGSGTETPDPQVRSGMLVRSEP